MTNTCYPVALCLEGKHCLVVGGGSLAIEKVEGLLHAGALVTLVTPTPTLALVALSETHPVTLRQRPYQPEDLHGIALAYGADEDRAINARVAADARAAGVVVNAVDDIPNCDFYAVSLVRRGELQVAISTNGASPAFARWMREYLDEIVPQSFGNLLSALKDVRQTVRAAGTIVPYDRWKTAIDNELSVPTHFDVEPDARERIIAALTPDRAAAAGVVPETVGAV